MGTTRRSFLFSGSLLAASRAFGAPFRRPKSKPSPLFRVYFGTDTLKSDGKGIYRASFNADLGQLTPVTLAARTVQPSFLALGTQRRTLYAVNEAADASSSISSFAVDPGTGDLREVGMVSSGSSGPCYIAIDTTGHAAFVANYGGGSVSSYRVQPNGTLGGPVDQVDFHNERFGKDGPNKFRQDAPHPHSATISPDDRFLVVNDLGHDVIAIFTIDPDTAKLSDNPPFVFNARPGSGPRHVAFHPNGRWVYGVNELSSTVDQYLFTTTHGQPPQALLVLAGEPVKTIADATDAEKNTAAEIAVAPNGYFLYVSNRGEDSLVVFAIDQLKGSLKPVQRIACGGKTPRHFTFDPTGRWLLCANQGSGSVTVFGRDAGSGRLSGPVQTVEIPTPFFTLFA